MSETVAVEVITNARGREVRHLSGCSHVTRARRAGKPVDGPVDMAVRDAWGPASFDAQDVTPGADVADCLAGPLAEIAYRAWGWVK